MPPPVVKVPKDKLQYINDLDVFFTSKEEINDLTSNDLITEETVMHGIENNSIESYERGLRAITSRNYIVGSLSAAGIISFAENPNIHITNDSAKREAERLAKANPGRAFIYVQFAGAVANNSVHHF